MNAFAALGGALAGLGVLLLLGLFVSRESTVIPVSAPPRRRGRSRTLQAGVPGRRVAIAAGAALLAVFLTGWPVAAGLAALAVCGLPVVLGSGKETERSLARWDALADWTRRLSDLIAVGAALEDAIMRSAATAPAPIADPVQRLAGRLRAQQPTPTALHSFADDLNDPLADEVVAALLLSAGRAGRGLTSVLTQLATSVADKVAARRDVEADRAKPRTSMRYVLIITLTFTVGLALINPSYTAKYQTVVGQTVLAMAGLIYATAAYWMYNLARLPAAPRFLPAPAGTAVRGTW